MLHVVWRQWRVLGGGSATRSESRSVLQPAEAIQRSHLHALIDPEALVVISLVLIQDERRLGDLLHDWAVRNSDLLSVQRMKNLEADYPEPVRGLLIHRLSWFATVARDGGKDLRWRSLAQASTTRTDVRGEQDGYLSVGESYVRTHGTYAPVGTSGKTRATRARLTADAALLLRLRRGFGIGVKADLLGFLLARVEEWATVRDIADATHFTVAAVRRAAEDLAASCLIESIRGQPTGYRATYGGWAPLLGFDSRPPRWASWHERFAFATAFIHWAEVAREPPLSAYAFGAYGRHLLERHRPAFERDLIAVWSPHSPVQGWGAFVASSVRSLATWMEEMA